ncbi:MAG: tetratricopeptide repeat protein [Chloroflexi bacterium]|nr:tetratricopeptide repeat protein [Chloroflexota bacterium]
MGRIEKTVFISYRRTNYWTALAIFQNLNANGYDVFFDYKSIPSGDFEQAIIENIKSRAHFVVILSPSALERCNEPGDWLRREMETAIENQRNIIPLMMEGFDFGSPSTLKALTGKLDAFKRYNGLGIPAEYFDEAMTKLRGERFLNKPLELVSHPVADITKQITGEQKYNANEAAQVEADQLTAEELFERAYAQQEAKNYDEAIRYYTEAIQLEPDLNAAYNNLGVLLNTLKRYDEAEAAYRKAIEINPAYASAYYNLGVLLNTLKRYDEAEAAYRKAIEINPAEASAYNNLVILLRLNNRIEETMPLLEKIIEINPEDFNPYLAIASINKQNGKSVSKEFIEKARQFMPEDDWHNRACLESVCDNFDMAFEYLEKAAQLERFNPNWAWDDPDLQWLRNDPRFVLIVGSKPK